MRVPRRVLLPIVVLCCVVGAFAINGNLFDVGLMLALGVLGVVCERLQVPVGPMVLGIVNPAPARKPAADLLRVVDVLTPNETEAELLTGIRIRTARDAAKAAVALGEGRSLVVAARFAAAATSITRLGAQPSAPKRWGGGSRGSPRAQLTIGDGSTPVRHEICAR